MVTRLDCFKEEMENSKEIYSREIEDFTKKYPNLGKMTIEEELILILKSIFSLSRT